VAITTQLFLLSPWLGGLNTSQDPALIPNNQLSIADHLIFGVRGTRKKRDGIDYGADDASNGSDPIIYGIDFFYGTSSRTQIEVGVTAGRAFYSYSASSLARTTLTDGGTAWTGTLTAVSGCVLNNILHLAASGTGNVIKKWTGSGNLADLGGTPPVGSILREHQGRLWTNDKTNLDRLHYSTTFNTEEWNGAGDSGALDIGVGDGDPSGITAIFPTFKGVLFVAKKTKLYRVLGDGPENYDVQLVTSGIGCVSHNAVVSVDDADIFFPSERGYHSLLSTQAFGDFESKYLSADIQATYNENFTPSRRPYMQGVYLSQLNSVAWAVTDNDFSASVNKCVYLYNVVLGQWYRWPNISCDAMWLVRNSDQNRLLLGTSTTRIAKTFNGTNYDVSAANAATAIIPRIKTGRIFVDDNPYTIKGFKKVALIFRPSGTYNITVKVKIDNYATQTLSFSDQQPGDLLGSTFVLGQSVLGGTFTFNPYTQSIDGYGRGIEVEIFTSGTEDPIEIQGLAIEWEPAETGQEVVT